MSGNNERPIPKPKTDEQLMMDAIMKAFMKRLELAFDISPRNPLVGLLNEREQGETKYKRILSYENYRKIDS